MSASPRPFDCVVAADAASGIGRDNDLPWPRLREDLRFLKRLTQQAPEGRRNAVVMGRKTWESVPSKMQPLPGRLNVVLSRHPLDVDTLPDGAIMASSLDDALIRCDDDPSIDRVFIIGGAEIYRLAFADPRCRDVYLTRIAARFDCDTSLPPLEPTFAFAETLARHQEHGIDYAIERWRRV